MIQPACPSACFTTTSTTNAANTANAANMDEAHRRSLQRLLQALLREGFLHRADLINEGAVTWLPLWKQKRMLKIEGMEVGRAGHCHIRGNVWIHQAGTAPRVIHNAGELLDYLW